MGNEVCTIWYNPACSNCRGTLKILEGKGIDLRVRHYLEDPPTKEELKQAFQHIEPIHLVRQKEDEFAQWRDRVDTLETSDIVEILTSHPKVLQRPVVFWNNKAIISRPPERVEELFPNA